MPKCNIMDWKGALNPEASVSGFTLSNQEGGILCLNAIFTRY